MIHLNRSRSRLLLGCGSAALALALAIAPQQAEAQAINANGTVVFGSAEINTITTNVDQIDVFTDTVVIDWVPTEDAAGNALDFLPTGNTAIFQSTTTADFAVLNRILPSTNGNIAVINGSVISQFQNVSGPTVPGGFIAFYSPTGLLIGSTATFDVGALMLTTLNTTDTSFQNFAEFGGNLALTGAPGSTARIQINPGAQILATPENSFFAVVAADVQMLGSARINGSHAYVAGEVVNLSFSNGLFDISVPVGTAATGQVMTLDGNVGGPSSNGLGDNHMIYALARASQDPISMLFTQNLGFDPAQSAGIVNGEIILSANHNVFGRTVDGGSISDGIDAVFGANSATSDVQADILIQNFTATSSLLAISSHNTDLTAGVLGSSVSGNLLLVGRARASMGSSFGTSFTVSGDVLVSAQDYGVVSSSLQNLDVINAAAGNASIFAGTVSGSSIDIGGNVLVAADAFAGADDLNRIAGSALAGQASIVSSRGDIAISGNATVSARGIGTSLPNIQSGATVRGGLALFAADTAGTILLDGNLNLSTDAFGSLGSLFSPSSVSNAYGGQSRLSVQSGGGSIAIGGDAFASASAVGGSSNNAGAGSIGDAGQAIANINDAGLINITGGLQLEADGTGGANAGGTGGVGLGGRASSALFTGGTINVGLGFNAEADGLGGTGQTGGAGFGGIAGAIATIGDITIGGSAFASAAGLGGGAFFGFGGNGGLGRGGNAFLQANGTLAQTATLTIGGDATASARGVGGDGGQSDGQAIVGGRGGDGYGGQFTVPNQADPAFSSGAFILAGGDNGTLSVGGDTMSLATGFGGRGGSGISNPLLSGAGGNGFGGLAQAGLALLGQNGSRGEGSASFGLLQVEARGFGGAGGFSGNAFPSGNGGNGTGGTAFLTVRAGDITADQIKLAASGFGADGGLAGNGGGGQAAVLGGFGGTLTANQINILAHGVGGFSGLGTGGNATGGLAAIEGDGISFTINGDATVDAYASGGRSNDGAGGNATGGEAYVATVTPNTPGAINITGHARVSADAIGGNTLTNFVAANGTGGTAFIEALGGSTINMGSAQVHAVGRGGSALTHQSGNGTGGAARISASGANSRVTILRNVPISATNTSGGIAIVSSMGFADTTNGGNGIGGTGRGGTTDVTATAGGSLNLPTNIASDPNAAFGSLSIQSRGFGGNSVVEGGAGGAAFGGTVTILADGGSITMGKASPSTFSTGGRDLDPTRNISGGNGTGGSQIIRVLNGGQLTMEGAGGGAGAQGGNGSGTGNGGNATAGNVVFEVIGGTANLVGNSILFNRSEGGTGQVGGNVSGGSITVNLNNAQINLLPDAAGIRTLSMSGNMQGGLGVTAGGNAQGTAVNLTIAGSTISGGRLEVIHTAVGGNALDAAGVGGNATGATIDANITGSQLNLVGEALFAADATGGAGGTTTGVGGNANSGTVDVDFASSTIAIAADAQGNPGVLRLRSQAIGGVAATIGSATSNRAQLNLAGTTLTANSLYVESRAFAGTAASGQTGGIARAGEALFDIGGTTQITANLLELASIATTSQGGSATSARVSLEAIGGSNATLNVAQINASANAVTGADATNGIAGATQGGQVFISANGGNLTITGNVLASARGIGVTVANLVSGATARGGLAQLRALQGGSVTLNGNITLDASATGSTGSLTSPSSVSDAFGGNAQIFVLPTGGTLTINGNASLAGNARGGSSNNSGAGSLADAGVAIMNIDAAGTIDISGRLILDARATGGTNAGGIGGMALGGRASTATFNGGTIRIGQLDADTLAAGGNGRTGGNAFGGIAGVNAIIGQIAINGRAFAGTVGVGGIATFGTGGNGGNGRGGNSFFQANGTLTQTARVSITGDAIASAQGVGGNGGIGDAATAGGRGGDGFGGGQGNVPNQADPAFGSGAFILAGGDNGTIIVGGEAAAVGAASAGGNGGPGTAGGRGGDALGGLAQAGLAILGGSGAVGLGSAQLNQVLIQSDAFAGDGGTASLAAQTGTGGNGTAGTSALTVRAGDVIASAVEMTAFGFGGRGGAGGNGTGGFAGVLGSFAGSLSLGTLQVRSNGYGGEAIGTGNGGIGRAGEAFLNYSLIDANITGDVLIEASGFGGNATTGTGGDGIALNARIGTLGTAAGNGTIAGTTRVFANGTGGTGTTTGSGTGGRAEALAQNGGVSNFAALQLNANGQRGNASGGAASILVGNGTSQLTATSAQMTANASSGAANSAGRFEISVSSGLVNLGSLTATASGSVLAAGATPSRLSATGGSLGVTGALSASTIGDLSIVTTNGNFIGSPAAPGATNTVQLQAGGTITVTGDGSTTNVIGGQSITALAGRSIVIDGNLATFNGAVTLTANNGGAPVQAQPPVSVITMAQGARINAGTGTVTIRLLDGAGDPQRVNGAITLTNILGGRIDVRNLGTSAGSNISVLAGGVLSASGNGRAIDLASLNGEVINLAGDAGLVLTGGGHYGIFAATPTGSQIGSFANYTRRYNVAAATAYGTLNPGGNFAAFRIAPVLTVTANNATRFYGSADPVFTASFTGFQPGDGVAGISGMPLFTTSAAATSNIGTFTLNAALGSLLSAQGYQFTFNPGLLTITARPITVTANNLSRIYGNANPALTFTVGGQGLANGDQLSGALATTANATTGVGTVAITQGSLAASSNYQLTFVGGLLTITQRLLTVTADDLSKLLGEPDPDLTFVVSGDGLVNGNQLTGVLVRDPGEAISTFAIRQGTLNAGSNYAISFVEGTLTINAPPAPPSINNPSVIDAALQSAVQDPPLTAEEEEERFGMDFPDQPEASLISEDPLLDDPVSSGGDASLYSGGTTPEPRGEEK